MDNSHGGPGQQVHASPGAQARCPERGAQPGPHGLGLARCRPRLGPTGLSALALLVQLVTLTKGQAGPGRGVIQTKALSLRCPGRQPLKKL